MKTKLLVGVVAAAAVVLAVININSNRQSDIQKSIAQKIIRFHVVGNSDSESDQKIKLKIRDAVGEYLSNYLKESDSIENSRKIINEHLSDIEDIAAQTLATGGYKEDAKASLGIVRFPEKSYGAYTFPEGEYEALEIKIGEAKGANWWCVLFPNICFRGTVYELSDDKTGKILKEVLNDEEYAAVFEGGKYQIRSKILEFWD